MDKTPQHPGSFRLWLGSAAVALALLTGLGVAAVAAADNPQVLRVPTTGSRDLAFSAAVDGNGNFILAGFLDDPAAPSTFGIAKFSPEGRLLWRAHYAGPVAGTIGTVRHVTTGLGGYIFATGIIAVDKGEDALTVKFAPDGAQVWAQRYPNGAGARVAVDAAGNVYVGGESRTATSDWLLIKYDANGSLQWQKTSDGPARGEDRIVDMQLTADNQIAVAGFREHLTPGFGTQAAVAKYDTNGNRRWLRSYLAAGQRDSLPLDLTLDARGNAYITGLTSADLQNAELATIPFTLMLNANGAPQLELNGTDAGGVSVDVDADGNIVLAGSISQDAREAGLAGALLSSVSKFDRYGTRLWSVKLGARGNVDVVRARVIDNGNIFVAGGFVTAHGNGYLARKLTADGATLWEHRRQPGGRDIASDLVVDAGRALLLGHSSGAVQTDMVALLFSELAPEVSAGATHISTSQ